MSRQRDAFDEALAALRAEALDGVQTELPMCGWFIKCGNPADWYETHPVLGSVPICRRCAAVVGIEDPR